MFAIFSMLCFLHLQKSDRKDMNLRFLSGVWGWKMVGHEGDFYI